MRAEPRQDLGSAPGPETPTPLSERTLTAMQIQVVLLLARSLLAQPDYRDWGGEVFRGYRPLAEALVQWEAVTREHLQALERWAGEQNADNAFAEQVRYWALARLAALDNGAEQPPAAERTKDGRSGGGR